MNKTRVGIIAGVIVAGLGGVAISLDEVEGRPVEAVRSVHEFDDLEIENVAGSIDMREVRSFDIQRALGDAVSADPPLAIVCTSEQRGDIEINGLVVGRRMVRAPDSEEDPGEYVDITATTANEKGEHGIEVVTLTGHATASHTVIVVKDKK